MAYKRISVADFSLANPLYVGALVTFWAIDANGDKTSTKITLYEEASGTDTLGNPQRLDGDGKLKQPVYFEAPFIATVANTNVADHDSGVIRPPLSDADVAVAAQMRAEVMALTALVQQLADEAETNASLAESYASYDFGFQAGWGSDGSGEDVAVQTFAPFVLARDVTFLGEEIYADTAPTGAALIVDVELNSSSIYSTKPQIAAGANAGTDGTLSTPTGDVGDRVDIKVTQVGSTVAGQKLRGTIKAKLR